MRRKKALAGVSGAAGVGGRSHGPPRFAAPGGPDPAEPGPRTPGGHPGLSGPHPGAPLSPFGLPDLEAAAARLGRAVRQGEPLAVYGDYDADGITATCLLHQFFQELGLPCLHLHPRPPTEGYGLKVAALKELAAQARLAGDRGLRHQRPAGGGLGQGARGSRSSSPTTTNSPRSCPRPWRWSTPSGAATLTPSAIWPGWGWPCSWPWGCGPSSGPRAGSGSTRSPISGPTWTWWPWAPRPTWCRSWGKTASWCARGSRSWRRAAGPGSWP